MSGFSQDIRRHTKRRKKNIIRINRVTSEPHWYDRDYRIIRLVTKNN